MLRVGAVLWVLWIRCRVDLGWEGDFGVLVGLVPGLLWLRLSGLACQPMFALLGGTYSWNSIYPLCRRPELGSGYQLSANIRFLAFIVGGFES